MIIMINELEKIKDSVLLNNIKVDELSSMLECLKGVIKHYKKGKKYYQKELKLKNSAF